MHAIETRERTATEIHRDAIAVSKSLRSEYLRLFDILLEVESRKIYYEFDVPSLHQYCVELLELSKNVAHDFITVVRKSLEVPQLAESIRSGKVTISKARKICPVLDETNSREWIDLAIHCTCREIERTVAAANPRAAIHESLKYVSGEALELKVGVSEEWSELLTRTKDLMSQRKGRAISTEEAIFESMADYCRKSDPVEKAKRAQRRSPAALKDHRGSDHQVSQCPASKSRDTRITTTEREARAGSNRHLPARVEQEVDLRDQGRCTFVDSNDQRCTSRRWLEKHHIVEFAAGGKHETANLETLCSGHHKVRHLKKERLALVTLGCPFSAQHFAGFEFGMYLKRRLPAKAFSRASVESSFDLS